MRQYFSMFKSLKSGEQTELPGAGVPSTSNEPSLDYSQVLGQISRSSSDFVTVHQRTGVVDDCSISTSSFNGLQSDDLLAGRFMERVHIADRPACLGAFSAALHEGVMIRVELRLRCLSPDDTPDYFCWIEMSCSALSLEEGAALDGAQILCISRDITRWKEREHELIAREQAALELSESKTRFLTNMSHELRTPLNAIIGFSEMMKLPGITAQNEQQMVEYAGIINTSGQHLLGVVDEVFHMSQFEAGHYKLSPEIFSVTDLVEASVELVQFEAEEKGVRFVIEAFDESLRIYADQQACRLTLVGLLAVQIKQSAEKGRVHLSVRETACGFEFVLTGSDAEGAYEPLLGAGSQLSGFVDLLQAELCMAPNNAGQREMTLKIPSGSMTDVKSDNVVSLDNATIDKVLPLKKSA